MNKFEDTEITFEEKLGRLVVTGLWKWCVILVFQTTSNYINFRKTVNPYHIKNKSKDILITHGRYLLFFTIALTFDIFDKGTEKYGSPFRTHQKIFLNLV